MEQYSPLSIGDECPRCMAGRIAEAGGWMCPACQEAMGDDEVKQIENELKARAESLGAELKSKLCQCDAPLDEHTGDNHCGRPQAQTEPWEWWRCRTCKLAFRSPDVRFQCQCPGNPMDVRQVNEKAAARKLGEAIGYGRMMQLGEQLWREKLASAPKTFGPPGGEHATYCAVTFLVPCRCMEDGNGPVGCDWCCGAGRVTKRVKQVQEDEL